MDLVVIDVTDAPGVRRGEAVELLGSTITLDAAARRAGTIGYELPTRLGLRHGRRMIGGESAMPAIASVAL